MVEAAVLVRCFDGRRLMTIRTIIPAAGLLLAGCTSPPDTPPLWVTEHGRIYCYATIADPDCSKAPVPGADRRLIAVAPRLSFVPLDPAPPVSPSSAEGPVPLGPHDQQSETKGATGSRWTSPDLRNGNQSGSSLQPDRVRDGASFQGCWPRLKPPHRTGVTTRSGSAG